MYHDGFIYDEVLLVLWAVGCLVGGLSLLVGGVPAAGSALLGSLVGAFVGSMLVSSTLDSLPFGAALGASVGIVAFGVLGLLRKPRASRSTLRIIAGITAVVGTVVLVGLHVGADLTCHLFGPRGQSCLPRWGPWAQALLVFDVAFLALLFLLQAAHAPDPRFTGSAASY